MIKRLPSMIVPALLLIAVLSTSVVKPAEYVRISPSGAASPLVRVARPGPSVRLGGGQRVPANFDSKRWCAVRSRNPGQLEPLHEFRHGMFSLFAAATGEHMPCDP